ncbi:MAG: prolipoprotein diacylglyceryl transferase [Chthoniobacterales bacterium]
MTLAYYVHDLSPFLIHLWGSVGLRWYGLAYVGAFFAGIVVYRYLARRGYSDLKPDQVSDFIIWGAIFGVLLGGRVGYMLFYRFSDFVADPLSLIRVWDGGMASHGGIIGLVLFTLWYSWRHKVGWRNVGDNLVVVAPIGLFFGRVANFINGELYGRAATVPWAVQFPKELYSSEFPVAARGEIVRGAVEINPAWTSIEAIVPASRQSEPLQGVLADGLTPRHPSQLYEAALEGLVLFAILWVMRTRFKLRDGVITGAFFIGYALLRIAGEAFREPDAPLTGLLTRGQFLSLFLVIIGIAFMISARIRPRWAPKWR